jgi:hypothetical protein
MLPIMHFRILEIGEKQDEEGKIQLGTLAPEGNLRTRLYLLVSVLC